MYASRMVFQLIADAVAVYRSLSEYSAFKNVRTPRTHIHQASQVCISFPVACGHPEFAACISVFVFCLQACTLFNRMYQI
ncbi:hypothetical protein DXA95_17540 [Odoribacter sp. OF09-27XD]|nr:hypothetical protein DXA95_17540 [Odoribacter sp. OF09-27XD]